MTDIVPTKKWWDSKTLWINALFAGTAGVLKSLGDSGQVPMEILAFVVPLVNFILRPMTSTKLVK